MKLNGQCFCGAVSWEADVDEEFIGICHCRDCQILGGGAFRTIGITAPAAFRFTAGTPKHYAKRGDSGAVRVMNFCGECGTHLCSMPEESEDAGFVSIRISTSEQFGTLKPAVEIFCDSRLPWQTPVEGAQQFPKMPG